ncbi:unnamed protein product [Chrysoparadoxa australica]
MIKAAQKLEEEVALFERGLRAREKAEYKESEKLVAEGAWQRLLRTRERRHGRSLAKAAAMNNVGMIMVQWGKDDPTKQMNGRKLLEAALELARELAEEHKAAEARKARSSKDDDSISTLVSQSTEHENASPNSLPDEVAAPLCLLLSNSLWALTESVPVADEEDREMRESLKRECIEVYAQLGEDQQAIIEEV